MAERNSPTVAKRALNRYLRDARKRGGKSQVAAAKLIGVSTGTVSKYESGEHLIAPASAEKLAKFYGASEDEASRIFELAHAAKSVGWWKRWNATPAWFDDYVGLETEASVLRNYEPEFIPGMLQTRSYAETLARVAVKDDELVQQHADVRMARQERLLEEEPVRLHAIVNEAVLLRQVGGTETMHGQLRQLIDRASLPNLHLRVVPLASGAHPANYGAFMILNFPDFDAYGMTYSEVVYSEYGPGGAVYVEEQSEVAEFIGIFESLQNHALDEKQTSKLIRQILDERY